MNQSECLYKKAVFVMNKWGNIIHWEHQLNGRMYGIESVGDFFAM